MSALALCVSCETGDHEHHVDWPVRPPEGGLGGVHCPCPGDCKPHPNPLLDALAGAVSRSREDRKSPEELDRLPSIDVSGTDRIYLDTEAMIASARKEGAVQALRDAADAQRRLGRSPRALKSRAVAFKRELFAVWLDERADRIEQT